MRASSLITRDDKMGSKWVASRRMIQKALERSENHLLRIKANSKSVAAGEVMLACERRVIAILKQRLAEADSERLSHNTAVPSGWR